MPRIDPELQRLQDIKSLRELIKYLKVDLNWPIGSDDVEDVVYDYDPAELGFDSASTAKIEEVCQLRPLTPGQKWGVFWVKFGKKQLPVQMLRRALGNLVIKKRTSTKKADKAAWHMHDLLFISAYGDDSNRHITFAHFSESADSEKSLPVLKVLGWDDDDTILHLQDTYKTLVSSLNWDNTPVDDLDAWREHWASAFKVGHREVINTTKELVVELAHLATVIKKSVLTSINAETEKGPWKRLMLAFQKTLIKDLNEEQFADVIAQTISYGLLTARLSSDGQISLKNLVDMVPSTNPFLKELLQHFLTSAGMKGLFDVDEAGINDVVELLNRANAQAIRNDFGKKTDGEDPVIHFYEHFLGAYNKKLKVERGVFYTPKPIVSYIVRSVHELLKKEFGLEDGLADTATWAEVKKRHTGLKIPEGINPDIEPFVQILDPATGTATFLIEVIDVIHGTMTSKWDKARVSKVEQIKKWNVYVPNHLLPRLYAYELMMAPYAIAHMKVGLKLTETGFTAWEKLGAENRANIFLTNALEPWSKQLELPGFDALAHEAAAVNEVKRSRHFTVIIGNPPYSSVSKNTGEWISEKIEAYKHIAGVHFGEKKHWLQDDYVKFIRLAESHVEASGSGIVGYINNHSFLDNSTFRAMRWHLLETFDDISICDLHGNSVKKETKPDGGKDENVFEIQTGVSIALMTTTPMGKANPQRQVLHCDIWGSRAEKHRILSEETTSSISTTRITPTEPSYFLLPKSGIGGVAYKAFISVQDIFPINGNGIVTMGDSFAVSETSKTLEDRLITLLNNKQKPEEIREEYSLGKNYAKWITENRGSLRKKVIPIIPIDYRPFDRRFTFWDNELVWRWRHDVARHLIDGKNLALCFRRQQLDALQTFYFISEYPISDGYIRSDNKGGESMAPLFLIPEDDDAGDLLSASQEITPNIDPRLAQEITEGSGMTYTFDPKKLFAVGVGALFTPYDILCYCYGVLHSNSYRNTYKEFLVSDFPRIPKCPNSTVFRKVSGLGRQVIELHTMKESRKPKIVVECLGKFNCIVSRAEWSNGCVFINDNLDTGFKNISRDAWQFHIGGHQVCEKWIKDRKGRKLTKDDIEHYQKIVVAISETIRLMAEIDKVIDEHGGWPGAFQAAK